MVAIVVETWYPVSKAVEIGNKFLEAEQQYPFDKSLGKLVVPVIAESTKKGMHTIRIMTCKKDKIFDCAELATKRMLLFSTTEGFSYTVRVYFELAEAMPLLGLTPPEQ